MTRQKRGRAYFSKPPRKRKKYQGEREDGRKKTKENCFGQTLVAHRAQQQNKREKGMIIVFGERGCLKGGRGRFEKK